MPEKKQNGAVKVQPRLVLPSASIAELLGLLGDKQRDNVIDFVNTSENASSPAKSNWGFGDLHSNDKQDDAQPGSGPTMYFNAPVQTKLATRPPADGREDHEGSDNFGPGAPLDIFALQRAVAPLLLAQTKTKTTGASGGGPATGTDKGAYMRQHLAEVQANNEVAIQNQPSVWDNIGQALQDDWRGIKDYGHNVGANVIPSAKAMRDGLVQRVKNAPADLGRLAEVSGEAVFGTPAERDVAQRRLWDATKKTGADLVGGHDGTIMRGARAADAQWHGDKYALSDFSASLIPKLVQEFERNPTGVAVNTVALVAGGRISLSGGARVLNQAATKLDTMATKAIAANKPELANSYMATASQARSAATTFQRAANTVHRGYTAGPVGDYVRDVAASVYEDLWPNTPMAKTLRANADKAAAAPTLLNRKPMPELPSKNLVSMPIIGFKNTSEFGKFIGWGNGGTAGAAIKRMNSLTDTDIRAMASRGLTRDDALKWANAYWKQYQYLVSTHETMDAANVPVGRALLMESIARRLPKQK